MGVTWDRPEAAAAVSRLYGRLLGRGPDPDIESHVRFLVDQNRTLQEVVQTFGESAEYYQKWVAPSMGPQLWGTPITWYYRHFLDREPEGTPILVRHSEAFGRAQREGRPLDTAHRELVRNFVRSDEYARRWGPNGVPGVGAVPTKAGGGVPGERVWDVCVRPSDGTSSATVQARGPSPVHAAQRLQEELNRNALGHVAIGYTVTAGPCQ